MTELDKKFNIVNEKTPLNEFLSAHYKRSFAHYTIRDRLPVIITRVIDILSKDKEIIINEYGEKAREDLKEAIGNISKLKYELQTDKIFKPIDVNAPDQEMWNNFLEKLDDSKNSYFSAPWLYAECYMYRRLRAIFEETSTLKEYDYFRKQKETAFTSCLNAFIILTERLNEARESKLYTNREEFSLLFKKLLRVNLWGNRIDLSISVGSAVSQNLDPFEMLDSLESYILVDQTEEIWNCIASSDGNVVIDIISDNSGYELFTDLCLADFIISHNLAAKIRFHVKAIPWFVSDVIPSDFRWTLDALRKHDSSTLHNLGQRLTNYLETGHFELCDMDYFWTSPFEYNRMEEEHEKLYKKLSNSQLIIFKGDLNYRKLLGDLNWNSTIDFPTALRHFRPSNLCTLRTIKADLICGLAEGKADELTEKDAKWMETGDYGVIQFASKD